MDSPHHADPSSNVWRPTTCILLRDPDEEGESSLQYDARTEEGFVRFRCEYMEWAMRWVYRHRGGSVRDDQTAEEIVADAFGALFARREDIRTNPRGALIGHLRNSLREFSGREVPVGSLGARSADSQIGVPLHGRFEDSPSTEAHAQEMGKAFAIGVTLLRPRLREVHDLRMKGLKFWEIAHRLKISEEAAEKRDEAVRVFLTTYMARYDPYVAQANAGIARKKPLRTARAARKAIKLLPSLPSTLIWAIYLAGVPIERAWVNAGCVSVAEAKDFVEQGLETLSLLYDQKMPDELVRALATNTPSDKWDSD